MLQSNGFRPVVGEQCMLSKTHKDGTYKLVVISSDDHIITASNQTNLDTYHELLSTRYETKRLCFPTKYLGWNFKKFQNGFIGICQPLLIDKLVTSMNMELDKPSISNMHLHPPPIEDESPAPKSAQKFAELVGYLRYLAESTIPDIFYLTSVLASTNKNPKLRHYQFLRKVTRYLKGPRDFGLVFTPASGDETMRLCIYSPSVPPDKNMTNDTLAMSSDADF